jgi:hypothetical protein
MRPRPDAIARPRHLGDAAGAQVDRCRSRLTVVESGFAQLPEDDYRKAFDGNTEGWASELGELLEYLDATAA